MLVNIELSERERLRMLKCNAINKDLGDTRGRGKVYLNDRTGVKKTWSEAIPKHLDEANRNWPGLQR